MKHKNLKVTLWLGLAAAAIVLVLPAAAQASTNVVPNPGFEQGGCGGNTTVICGWEASGGSISQDTTNPHSGNASMHLDCGVVGCYGDPYSGWASVQASTDAAFCAAIGPGVHPASFWYRDVVGDQVSLDATFYSGLDCTGYAGSDSLADGPSGGGWQQLTGAVAAPPSTQSVLFGLSVGAYCSDYCPLSANFDDVTVDDAAVTTPIITSFSPTSAPVGTSVDIGGYNFTGATSVTFNGTPAGFAVQSATSIMTFVPDGATSGPISVTTPNGTGTSSKAFTVIPPPTISSFTPTSGPVGTQVDILGQRFTGATYVTFNGTVASFTIDSDSEIHATVPCGATTGPIFVLTPHGNTYSSSSFTVTAQAPTISSFTPATGPAGTNVWIAGSNFCTASSVTFNGTPASFYLGSDSDIYTIVPSGATTGPIAVTTLKGTDISSSSFTVTHAAPIIDSFAPTSGPFGKFVDIVGSHFTAASSVKFNGTAAAFTVNKDTEIYTTVPCGATTGLISVTTPDGTTTSSSPFTVTALAPTISSFTPTSGPVGTSVDILGWNFCGASSLTFNGTSATFTVDSNSEIHATVPTGATTGPIAVTTPGGTGTSSSSYIVTAPPPPSVSSFSPASGPAATTVDIQGTNFTGATSLKFNDTPDPSFVVNSSTEITAHVPTGATTGPISVTTPGGTATSSTSFTVILPPTISSFTPTNGPVGTTVTINGSNFNGASSVTFYGTAALFTANSATKITATVPAGATTGPISVTTPGGTSASSTSFTVTAPLPPKITSFSPTSGHAGQQVTITGSNFTGATSIKLGTASAKFTVNSATKITATVPSIARGYYRWSVTNPAGTATSTGYFHVL